MLCALTATHHAAAVVGVLDSRGNHTEPRAGLAADGAAIVATRIAAPDGAARALSISTRAASRARWSAPTRLRAGGAVEHLVAAGPGGEFLVAWRSAGRIWAARPDRAGPGWTRSLLAEGAEVGPLLAAAVSDRGVAQVVWRSDDVVASALAGRSATRFVASPPLGLPPGAEIAAAGVDATGERMIATWRDPGGDAIGAALRRTPRAGWWTGIVAIGAADAPGSAINADGVAGIVWRDSSATPRLARRESDGAWSVVSGGTPATAVPDLQINRRGALLAQWVPTEGVIGGAYRPANRSTWIPTAVGLGRGFLRESAVSWVDERAEAVRSGRAAAARGAFRVAHVDERGDLFATLEEPDTSSLTLLQRRGGVNRPWRSRAIAAIGVERPIVVANRRGDVLAAFLTPSEFVPGALNSAIATTSPAVGVRGVRQARRGAPFVLRVTVPDTGRLALAIGRGARPSPVRAFGVARRPQLVRLRAPRRSGVYRVALTLRTPDGRRYTAGHTLRAR